MTAYTETTTLVPAHAERISRNFGFIFGTCDITNYNTTGVEITDITGHFQSAPTVICEQASDNNYAVQWDTTDKCFHAYYGVSAHTHVLADNYGPALISGVTVGTPKLSYDADPVSNKAATALYGVESYGAGGRNIIALQAVTNGNADVLGSTDDVSGICGAATPRFYVTDNNTPAGVKIYVNQSTNDQLEFISPTATSGYIIMPFEAIADGVPGFAYAVKVTHSATADAGGGTELFFDDNGAADAQLFFVDVGTSDGVIYASDIEVIAPSYYDVTQASGITVTAQSSAALTEVSSDVDVGVVNFVAFGLWK